MPVYSSTIPAPCLDVGSSIKMFDGTETPAAGLKSIAFARGHQGSSDKGVTFNISGMPAGMTIDVQIASINVDADYSSVATLSPSAGSPDSGNSFYTDEGRSAFYRLYVLSYTSGTMPIAKAQR